MQRVEIGDDRILGPLGYFVTYHIPISDLRRWRKRVLHNGISSSWIAGKDGDDGDERADGETSMGIKSFLSDGGGGLQLWTKD